MALDPDDLKLTAIHEAGHAFLQELFFPGEDFEVDIVGLQGLANGKTIPPPRGWRPRVSRKDREHDLLKALGGIAAESIHTGVEWHNVTGAEKDLEAACVALAMLKFQRGKGGNADRVRSCLGDRQTQLAGYYDSAKSVLVRNWDQVKKVAESLFSKNTLTGADVRAILGSGESGSTAQGKPREGS